MAKAKKKKPSFNLALDPSYSEPKVRQVDEAQILKSFQLTAPINRLNRVLKDFGMEVGQKFYDGLNEFVENEEAWAKDVHLWWWSTSPYESTNLRHAIKVKDYQFPKRIWVDVDRTIMLEHAGQTLKGWRTGRNVKIPSVDYLKYAEKNNKSAKRTPTSPEEPINDFTKSVWEEYANKRRKELFA